MDSMKLTTQNQIHGSDSKAFSIYPYGVVPPPPPPPVPQWLWIAIPLVAVGLGLAYLAVKKK